MELVSMLTSFSVNYTNIFAHFYKHKLITVCVITFSFSQATLQYSN